MKFDTVIIGGGLAGLVCGIRLQQSGKKCAIITSGESTLNFSSATFGLLSKLPDGTPVEKPLEAISSLEGDHPYSKIGVERMKEYASQTKPFFRGCGISLSGSAEKNSWYLNPIGKMMPAWLGFEDTTLYSSKDSLKDEEVLLLNIEDFLDFNTSLIAAALEKNGARCRIETIRIKKVEELRKSPTEMRSLNIARLMEDKWVWSEVTDSINGKLKGEEVVLIPQVFGLTDESVIREIKSKAETYVKTSMVGTMPPSVPGIRTEANLKKTFEKFGGTLFANDIVDRAVIEEDKVKAIKTENFGDLRIEADNFVLATGSFISKGLWADQNRIIETLLGLDVNCNEERTDWCDEDFFKSQRYLGYGVITDESFHPSIEGNTISNLYAIGSILGGFNPVDTGCGAGVAIMTAFAAADEILK